MSQNKTMEYRKGKFYGTTTEEIQLEKEVKEMMETFLKSDYENEFKTKSPSPEELQIDETLNELIEDPARKVSRDLMRTQKNIFESKRQVLDAITKTELLEFKVEILENELEIVEIEQNEIKSKLKNFLNDYNEVKSKNEIDMEKGCFLDNGDNHENGDSIKYKGSRKDDNFPDFDRNQCLSKLNLSSFTEYEEFLASMESDIADLSIIIEEIEKSGSDCPDSNLDALQKLQLNSHANTLLNENRKSEKKKRENETMQMVYESSENAN